MLNVYLYSMDQVVDVELPENIVTHTNKYSLESARRVSRFAYAMLGRHGVSLEEITFTSKGKAVHPTLDFSISHSKHYIAILIGESSCGIDVEEFIPESRHRIANKILNEKELLEYRSLEDPSIYLTQMWTLKEAYAKMIGTGLSSYVFQESVVGQSITLDGSIVSIVPKEKYRLWMNEEEVMDIGKLK